MKAIWMLMYISGNAFGLYSSDGQHLAIFKSERDCVKAAEESNQLRGMLWFCAHGLPAPPQAQAPAPTVPPVPKTEPAQPSAQR